MNKAVAYTAYPLSASLTRRVVNYLNIYRLIVVVLLAAAHFGSLLDSSAQGAFATIASVVLAVYLLVAVFHLFDGSREEVNLAATGRRGSDSGWRARSVSRCAAGDGRHARRTIGSARSSRLPKDRSAGVTSGRRRRAPSSRADRAP